MSSLRATVWQTIKEFILYTILLFVSSMVVFTIASFFTDIPLGEVTDNPKVSFLLFLATDLAAIFTLLFIVPREQVKALFRSPKFMLREIFLGMLLGIVVIIGAGLFGQWLESISPSAAASLDEFDKADDALPLAVMVVPYIFTAPILEEMYFRGVLLGRFRQHHLLLGIVLSSLGFGLVHVVSLGALYFIFLGVILALLSVWRKNIWLGVGVHMLNNLIVALVR